MKLRHLIIFISVLAVSMQAMSTNLAAERECRLRLAETTDPIDSLEILTDIFDASPLSRRGEVAKVLYPLAERLERTDLQLNILAQLASASFTNDSVMAAIADAAGNIPESDLQREVLTYIRVVKHVRKQGVYNDSAERDQDIVALTRKLNKPMPDTPRGVSERISDMFTVIGFLQRNTPGVLLEDILAKLDVTMRKLPMKSQLLRLAYFNQSAAAYTFMGKTEKAIKADSIYLSILDEMQQEAENNGRQYCTYDRNRYIGYRRMLYNHSSLPIEKVREIHGKINALMLREPDVAADVDENGRALIHYYVAEQDWEHAGPLIKKYIDVPENQWTRRVMIKSLITGAAALGDHATEVSAMREYYRTLEDYLASRYDERIRELQIVYGVNDLSERNVKLEQERKESIEKNQRVWIIVAVTVIPLLLLLLVGVLVLYRRSKRLTQDLAQSVADLRSERDNVLRAQKELIAARDQAQVASRHKTDFINNMTHEIRIPLNAIADYSRLIADCADDDKRPYLDHYAKLIDLNNELAQTMVNDVLDISEIDNSRLKINPQPVSANELCTMAVESVCHHITSDVTMDFVKPDSDVTINTDPRRVEQVLINLLSNAVKFTREGFVRLSYSVEDGRVLFSVADSGSGIPEGKEDVIFERFEKLDNTTQGAGLGLPIARLVAGMLRGTVTLDRSYSPGARFVFSIPLK